MTAATAPRRPRPADAADLAGAVAGHRLRAAGPAHRRRGRGARRGLRRGGLPGAADALGGRAGRARPGRPARRRDRRRVQRPPAPRTAAAACSARTPSPPPPRRSRGTARRCGRRPSPWRLGPGRSALTAEWLRGWVGAAVRAAAGARRRGRGLPAPAARRVRGGRAAASWSHHARPARAARGRWAAGEPARSGRGCGLLAGLAHPGRAGCGGSAPARSWTGCAGSTARRCSPRSASALLTTVLSAWRWCLVARAPRAAGCRCRPAVADYYRALFLNAALPGGVLGDVHRAVRARAGRG